MAVRTCVHLLVLLQVIPSSLMTDEETWQQDLSLDMKIGVSLTGYRGVDLICEPGHFHVNVSLDGGFEGVVYTRGSYSITGVESVCFTAKPTDKHGEIYSLKIPFEECRTIVHKQTSQYLNTLIVQHDRDLIMPGDAAFTLACSMERSLSTSAITVVDPDPAAKTSINFTERAQAPRVSFRPARFRDEL